MKHAMPQWCGDLRNEQGLLTAESGVVDKTRDSFLPCIRGYIGYKSFAMYLIEHDI